MIQDSTDKNSLTYEKARKYTDPIMEMVEIYQARTHKIELLALDRIKCSWWDFPKKAMLDKEICETITESNKDSRLDEIFEKFGQKIK